MLCLLHNTGVIDFLRLDSDKTHDYILGTIFFTEVSKKSKCRKSYFYRYENLEAYINYG